MQTRTLVLAAAMIASVAGGGLYLLTRHEIVNLEQREVPQTNNPQASASKVTDHKTQRKIEGIGSTRDLEPLSIPPGNVH